jgi:hypothetical protein
LRRARETNSSTSSDIVAALVPAENLRELENRKSEGAGCERGVYLSYLPKRITKYKQVQDADSADNSADSGAEYLNSAGSENNSENDLEEGGENNFEEGERTVLAALVYKGLNEENLSDKQHVLPHNSILGQGTKTKVGVSFVVFPVHKAGEPAPDYDDFYNQNEVLMPPTNPYDNDEKSNLWKCVNGEFIPWMESVENKGVGEPRNIFVKLTHKGELTQDAFKHEDNMALGGNIAGRGVLKVVGVENRPPLESFKAAETVEMLLKVKEALVKDQANAKFSKKVVDEFSQWLDTHISDSLDKPLTTTDSYYIDLIRHAESEWNVVMEGGLANKGENKLRDLFITVR